MNKKWATDKRLAHTDAHGNHPSKDDMATIFKRYVHAKHHYHNRPPYLGYKGELNMTIPDDGLPRFQPGCVCNMTLAVSNHLSHALTPFWTHAAPPESAADLGSYCPCSIRDAAWRLKQGFSPSFLPPSCSIFYHLDEQLASRWDPGSWWLWHQGSSWRHIKDELKQMWDQGWTVKHWPRERKDDTDFLWLNEDVEVLGPTKIRPGFEESPLYC
jgi:hypothetical protein